MRAAETFEEGHGVQFHSYALSVIRNHLLDYCRHIQSRDIPTVSLEDCLGRLVTRGLVASGTGETDFEALYDLLGGLYVVPLSESLPLRLAVFLKLTVLKSVPVSKAWELFRRDRPNEQEA